MFNQALSAGALLASARMRLMTSPARLPSLMMRSTDRRAASTLGGSLASQRRHALPLLTTPVSGWLI